MIFGIFFYFIIYIIGQAQLSSINVIISYICSALLGGWLNTLFNMILQNLHL